MKFQSTNGKFEVTSFSEAILTGLCPDGGLLMPEKLPILDGLLLQSWKHLNFPSLLTKFLQFIIDETDPIYEYLADIEKETFQHFKNDVIRIKELKNVFVMELFHGPTMAFKDYPMFPLAYLIDKAIKIKAKSNNHANIVKQNLLIATTGDTGSSALEASKYFPETLNTFVLFPKDNVTEIQRLQMTTSNSKNGHAIECSASGDELDEILYSLSEDQDFREKFNTSCLNSINCGRILCQIALHLYAYLQIAQSQDDIVNIAIPCGGCGNLISACLAYKMNVPIRIIVCTNNNDFSHNFIKEGVMKKEQQCYKTWSNAMDTQLPYNIVRLLWIFSDHDLEFTTSTMAKIYQGDKVVIPHEIMQKIRLAIIDSQSISDSETLEAMTKCYNEENYCICPHTATAVSYFYKREKTSSCNVALSTASIEKFADAAIHAGLPEKLKHSSLLFELRNRQEVFNVMDSTVDSLSFLKKLIASHNQ